MEETPPELRIGKFERIPSPEDFSSHIESKNVPAVFVGCVKDWKAFRAWDPANGGLHYLQERVGSTAVDAMLSRSAPVFYGDIRSHERVQLPFSVFIGFCKQRTRSACSDYGDTSAELEIYEIPVGEGCGYAGQQVYLAQVPILNNEDEERAHLKMLRDDIDTPTFLEKVKLASINLWMNNDQSRSSTHYDPHHNVLCVVAGCKQVTLWPPSAGPMLYSMPIYGEASNHSSVSLENPDFSLYPRAKHANEFSQKVVLQAGDALFIPEGWFHQVDSDHLTIAVNFWWRSYIMSSMSDHMDAYYLRRVLIRLMDKEVNRGLLNMRNPKKPSDGKGQMVREKGKLRFKLDELEPCALQALHELVSLVHERININEISSCTETTSTSDSAVKKDECKRLETRKLFLLNDDPVAKMFWILDPSTLQNVLLAMVHNFPRTLEALILHLLSPVGAEVLTRKFDEMDQQTTEEDQDKFFQAFYGVFDEQTAAMDAILSGKESFALQAFKDVLDKYLGVNLNEPPNQSVG